METTSTTYNYWGLVLDSLRTKVSASNFQSWFSSLTMDEVSEGGRKIILTVPSEFHRNFLSKKFSQTLQDAINKYYPKVVHVDFRISPQTTNQPVQEFLELIDTLEQKDEPAKIDGFLTSKNLSNLKPKYTFETFIVTRNTEFVYQVSQGVVQEPGTLYNPLFIHSNVGLGKTHLLQAIGHRYLEHDPSKNIKYVPAETFFNQYYYALSKKEVDSFRTFYASVDLLLIDDIQFISGKDSFQTIFFHIFNELYQNNKQIILTSDKSPQSLIGIEERLVSRFSSGLVVDIPAPDFDDRMLLIADKAKRLGVDIDISAQKLVAERVVRSVREIEGALNKIKAWKQQFPGQVLDEIVITRMLGATQMNETPVASINGPEKIQSLIASAFGVTSSDIHSASRERNIALARQTVFYILKTQLNLSYPLIGKIVGGKDHSTVMHGVKKIAQALEQKQEPVYSTLQTILKQLHT